MTADMVNPSELADRCARLEARVRTLSVTAVAALLAAAAGLALALSAPLRAKVPGASPHYRSVESERFVLVDGAGKVRARLEAATAGDARLTLGDDLGGQTTLGSALGLGVGPGLSPQLSLRRADGNARATLTAGQGLTLWSGEQPASGILLQPDGAASLQLVDPRRGAFRLEAGPPLVARR